MLLSRVGKAAATIVVYTCSEIVKLHVAAWAHIARPGVVFSLSEGRRRRRRPSKLKQPDPGRTVDRLVGSRRPPVHYCRRDAYPISRSDLGKPSMPRQSETFRDSDNRPSAGSDGLRVPSRQLKVRPLPPTCDWFA